MRVKDEGVHGEVGESDGVQGEISEKVTVCMVRWVRVMVHMLR